MNSQSIIQSGAVGVMDKDQYIQELQDEIARLEAILNTPLYLDFLEAVKREGSHQVFRFGASEQRRKEPQDWYWLVGYLAGKALRAQMDGDKEKALHHTISTAAVLMNWHALILHEHDQ